MKKRKPLKQIDVQKISLFLIFFFLFSAALVPSAVFAAWTIETADNPKYFEEQTQRAIATDSLNNIHAVFGTDKLYHAVYDGTQWQSEIVDSNARYSSVAVDANDKVHISYVNGGLRYATNTSGVWSIQIIDSPLSIDGTSIAIDSDNKAHISYYDAANKDLKYATNASGAWIKQTIDSSGDAGRYTSLAVDGNNKIHVSYYDSTNKDLKYATNTSGSWITQTIDSSGETGWYTSLAVDGNNKIHISYYDSTNKDLKYASNTSGSWIKQTIDSSGDAGLYNSIAIDSSNKAHISYQQGLPWVLRYATNSSGPWEILTIDGPQSKGRFSAIAIDSNDKIHISYFYYRNTLGYYDLMYATNVSGTWMPQNVYSSGSVGRYSSLGIDSNGKAHISYFDYANQDLKYATNAAGVWVPLTIDSQGDVGGGTSLALDSDDNLHVVYYDVSNSDIKYATNMSGSWVIQTIQGPGSFGSGSVTTDSNNKVHISYIDYTNYDLKYATNASGSWEIITIDSTGDLSWANSIAVDSNDKVHISYYEKTVGDLRYATNVSGPWVSSSIDYIGNIGEYNDIATDSNNKAHISYYDRSNQDLRYATNASGTWSINVVDSSGSVGEFSSIARDTNDKVHISYYDRTNGTLKYTTNASGSWAAQALDSGGWENSIAIDLVNKVHISYASGGLNVLKYATNFQPAPDITVTPVSVDFGVVYSGSFTDRTLTIQNDGNADLIIGNIAQADPVSAPFSIITDNCSGQTLASLGSCAVTLRFSPVSAGYSSDIFDIPSNDPDENSVAVSISGTGTVPYPDITVTPSSIGFGSIYIGASSDRTLTIQNDGNADLIIGNIAQADPVSAPFSIITDNCSGQTLASLGSCAVTLRFSPVSAGYSSDIFDIPSNDPDENSVAVNASGTGVLPPDISVSPAGFDFNLLKGSISNDILTITNSGEGDLTFNITTEETSGSYAQSGSPEIAGGYNKMLSADRSGSRKYKIPNGAEYSRKHILVKFKEGMSDSDKSRTHGKVRAAVLKRYKKLKLDKIEVADGKIDEVINEYLKDSSVEYAEPDYIVKVLVTPNDPGFSQLWGLHNSGQSGGTADADIDAPEAWDITTGGATVVAVIDTGVDYNHEDLAANMWVNPGETPGNGIDDDGNGYTDDYRGWDFINDDNDPMDDHGHGSHCSGTIAGTGNNSTGVTGVNWTAKIMPLKFLGAGGYGYTSDAVEAVLYAKNMGARVSSNSWGGGGYSQALYDAISSFGQSEGLFIAAAGNDGIDSDISPNYPSSFDLPNIVSVAATNRNDALAGFSNYGAASVDLAAPGVSIYSTVIGGYAIYSGTSMATPHVSGVAALLLSRVPDMSAALVKGVIMNNVDPITSLTGKMVSGGRLNARKAIEGAGVFWLSFSKTSGLIGPGANENITVTVDSSALSDGIYNVNIVISSNDPDENPLTVPVGLTVIADDDGDGFWSDTDCDDHDPLEHPDQTWYVDSDGDGYSGGDVAVQCLRPVGYYASVELIEISGDCNDGDPLEHPDQTWYLDADDDGYSGGVVNTSSCIRPAGYKTASELIAVYGDCDDNDPSVYPADWYADSDGDGFGNASVSLPQCTQPDGYVPDNTDCNDSNAAVNPGAHETAYNGIDDDCNPVTSDHPWYDFTIDASANGISHTSLAVDSNGKAHISYFESTSGDLKYSTNASGTWATSTIDSAGIAGEYNSIAADPNNKIHISYRFYQSGNGLKYATNESGPWAVTTITASEVVQDTSLAIDSNNKVHISFYTPNSDSLKYANNVSGPWAISTIDYDPLSSPGDYNSIAVDLNDKVHISYNYSSKILYATNQTGPWAISAIDATSSAYYSSIAVDPGNKVHVSYRDQSGNGYLKYATNASGPWARSIVDSGPGMGCNSSIAIDSNNKMHISHYVCSSQSRDLKYATNESGVWVTSVLDSLGDVGSYTSIAVDSSDNIHISYVDNTNKSLKYYVKHLMDVDNDADGFTENQGDCNDYDYSVSPAALETCDGADNNCNGQPDEALPLNTYYVDSDSDGYGDAGLSTQTCSGTPPAGYVNDNADCNDNDPLEHPDQIWYLDSDNDGYSEGTTDTLLCTRPAGHKAASELTGISGDCDDGNAYINPSTPWYPDTDGDGHGNPSVFLQQCTQPLAYVLNNTDCNDYDANIYPGGPPARIVRAAPVYFSLFQEAYDAAGDAETIEGLASTWTEDLNFNLNKTVVIEGGYDCGYTAITGKTILNGNLLIIDGAIEVGNFEVR